MKRRLLMKLCLFCLAGAMINIAVAWACGIYSDFTFDSTTTQSHNQGKAWSVSVSHGFGITRISAVPENGQWARSEKGYIGREHIPHWSRTRHPPETHEFEDATLPWKNELAFGWPCRSMYALIGRIVYLPGGGKAPSNWKVISGLEVLNDGSGRPIPFKVLPLSLVSRGFAINTIFYAAIVWFLFFAPRAIRRRVRRKRGQCAACGYSRRESVSEKCPECGATASSQ